MTRDEARRVLTDAGVADPGGDARRLHEHARQSADGNQEQIDQTFRRYIEQRAQRVPVSHIVGGRDFWKSRFIVTPDVLDPRPETEALIEIALTEPFSKVLDLGTGSGCILISLLREQPDATGVGTDVSEKAVLVAGENAAVHGVGSRVVLPLSDWYDDIGGRFDLIVSNPPYVAADEMAGLSPEVRDHEPRGALTDEGDGLSAYRAIAARAGDFLTEDGRLLVEIGWLQADDVSRIFRQAGLRDVCVHKDLGGQDRVVSARK